MAITVGDLKDRINELPDDANLFWYTGEAMGRFRTRIQAEWIDEDNNSYVEEIVSWSGQIVQGGDVG